MKYSYYVSACIDWGCIVFALSIYLFVCLCIKNLTIRHNFFIVSDRAFIFHISCGKSFPLVPRSRSSVKGHNFPKNGSCGESLGLGRIYVLQTNLVFLWKQPSKILLIAVQHKGCKGSYLFGVIGLLDIFWYPFIGRTCTVTQTDTGRKTGQNEI